MYKKVDQQDTVRTGTVERQNVLDGQPMVLVQMPGSVYDVYKRGCARALGYLQIIIGSICVILQIAAVVVAAGITKTSCPGFWGGCIFVICGVLGLVSAGQVTRSHVYAYLSFCIISIVCAVLLIILASAGIDRDRLDDQEGHVDNLNARYGINTALVVLGILEVIFATIAAFVCCHATCKRSTTMVGVKGHVEYKESKDKKTRMIVVADDEARA